MYWYNNDMNFIYLNCGTKKYAEKIIPVKYAPSAVAKTKPEKTYGVDGKWCPIRTIVLLQVDLASFLASGASSLGREAVNRGRRIKRRTVFESLYRNKLWSYFRSAQRGRQNWPFPSSKNSHDEAKCKTFLGKMIFICVRIKNSFTQPRFQTKARATRKWPIGQNSASLWLSGSGYGAILEDVL